MPDYKIRESRPGDLNGLYAVFSQANTLHRQAHPEIFKEADDPAEIKDFLSSSLLAQDTAVFVAETKGNIIGAVIALVRETAEVPILVQRTYLTVDNLVIADGYRQQGIGQALMESVHSWAKSRDIEEIQLTVWDFNQPALAFYRKLGYEMLHHQMRVELP